jgi:hypothetical protein
VLSFTSNSKYVNGDSVPTDRTTTIGGIHVVQLMLLIVLACIILEMGTYWWSRSISTFGRRMDSEYADALTLQPGHKNEPKSVLIVGNSTLRLGIDLHALQQDVNRDLSVHVFSLDATTYGDWYLGLEHLFRRGARPDFVVLLMPPGQMSHILPPTDDAAHYGVGPDEMLEVRRKDRLTLTTWSNVFFAHYSSFFARRNSLRLGIKRRMFPGFDVLASHYMTRKLSPNFALLPERFQEMNRLCDRFGVSLLYIIPPTNQEDDTAGAAPALWAAQAARVRAALPVANSQLSNDMYADGYHLNEAGRRIFTPAVAAFLKKQVNHEL